MPILFKKYLTYSEIGQIALCTFPFSFKLLWSPIVEFTSLPWAGKRKSWIIPSQLLMCVMLYYLSENLDEKLQQKELGSIVSILTFFVFIITCQDIAVDSWALEMLHPVNAAYGSMSQSIGQLLGISISTSFFISLNSQEFCAKWIYGVDNDVSTDENGQMPEPVLTLKKYMQIWGTF